MTVGRVLGFAAVAVLAGGAAFGVATWHYEARIDGLVATLQSKEFPAPRIVDRWHTTTLRVSDPAQATEIADLTRRLDEAQNRVAELESSRVDLERKFASVRRARERTIDPSQTRRATPAPTQYLTPYQQMAETADSDGIYQFGRRVGTASGVYPDFRNGFVRFGQISGNGTLNPDAEFQFRNLTLRMAGRSGEPGATMAGITQADVWENVVCQVVGEPINRE